MGPVSLYFRGLGGECEDGYGTLRGESGSTCDITILMMGTRESVAPLGLSRRVEYKGFRRENEEGCGTGEAWE